MNKIQRLHQATSKFRDVLVDAAQHDDTLKPWLEQMQTLFADIELNKISPPAVGIYSWPFHLDHDRYGSRSDLYSASAEFWSALEDWRSQPWARHLFNGENSGHSQ